MTKTITQFLIDRFSIPPVLQEWVGLFVMLFVAFVIAVAFACLFAGFITWVERRIAARIMSRVGPNRVGPMGLLQWLADALKSFLKEDIIPEQADKLLFKAGVYLPVIGFFAAFATLPFSEQIIAADLNVGILFILSVTSFTVLGLVFSGWGSNNKWALLGGMRSAAQIVSYEIPTTLSVLIPVMMAGSLSLQEITNAQGGWPFQWFFFDNPFGFIGFFIFFIATIAEGNRIPFDLPEAENELVAGFALEYSGMRYLFFYLVEWGNLYLIGALSTILFFGGWNLPGITAAQIHSNWYLQILALLFFWFKVSFFVFIIIQLRWTLPRLRIDQFMNLCWKYLVPIGFICLLGTLFWTTFTFPKMLIRYLLTLFGGLLVIVYLARVIYHFKYSRAKIDLNFLP